VDVPGVVEISGPGAEIFVLLCDRRGCLVIAEVAEQKVGHGVAVGASGNVRAAGACSSGESAAGSVTRLRAIEVKPSSGHLRVVGDQRSPAEIAADAHAVSTADDGEVVDELIIVLAHLQRP